MQKSGDAVSNTIGFILISGILLTSVAIIFSIGLPVYNNYVDQSHMQNMIEGFDLISENGNKVALLKTPYQQSELKLYGGTLSLKSSGTMNVQCYSDTAGNNEITPTGGGAVAGGSVALRGLEYTKGDTSVVYILGGVFKKDDYSYPVIKKPVMYAFDKDDNTHVLVMPMITFYDTQYSLTGTTLARISFATLYYSKKDQVVDQPKLLTYNHVRLVKITIQDSEYSNIIAKYFTDDPDMGFSVDAGESVGGKLVLKKTYDPPYSDGITVNTIQTSMIVTVNSGSV